MVSWGSKSRGLGLMKKKMFKDMFSGELGKDGSGKVPKQLRNLKATDIMEYTIFQKSSTRVST